jgi:ElaB/YqjD/DUF883 family membrane-anchored ribosome-binding protein
MARTDRASTLARDMRHVVSEVESLLREVGGGGTVHALRERVNDALDAAREQVGRLDAGVRSGARQAASVTNEYVHHNPWQAIGVWLVLGLAVGLLVMRR